MADEERHVETAAEARIRKATEASNSLNEIYLKTEALIARGEALKVERILAGRSDAGAQQQKKEETPQEYAQRVIKGGI